MSFRLGRRAAACAVLGLLLGGIAARAQDGMPDPITHAEAMAALKEFGPAWAAAAKGHPRLFFAPGGAQAEIGAFQARLAAGDPSLTVLVGKVRELMATPIRAYTTVEEENAKPNSHGQNEQELWQRGVGDQIVLLAFVSLLAPDPAVDRRLRETVETACRYPTWGTYGPDMDLACAHVARGVAVAWDWRQDLWGEADRQLITATIRERAGHLLEGLYGKAFWARGVQDNHNHVSVGGMALCGLAFYDEIPEAPEWLSAGRLDFQKVAEHFPADGSSHEGISYWSYALSFILQYVEGTRHVVDSGALYDAPFLRNAASYRLHASTSGLASILPWGDAVDKDFYGPKHILYRLAGQYRDGAALWLASHLPFAPKGFSDVWVWMAWWKPSGLAGEEPRLLDFHQAEGDIVSSRSGWDENDYLLSVKSGFTNRNHSHLDAGALAIAFGKDWVLAAPGYGKGSGTKGFWDNGNLRWTFLSNATESESTLLVNGANQRFDPVARATVDTFSSSPRWMWAGVDLTQAYADVSAARRNVVHRRGEYVLVLDSVAAPKAATVEWLAQLAADPAVSGDTLTAKAPGGQGQLSLRMLWPAQPFAPRAPTVAHLDLPEGRLHTFAVAQTAETGETSEFVALLGLNGGVLPQAGVERLPDRTVVTLRGAAWTDVIFQGATASFFEPTAAVAGSAGVTLNARGAALRFDRDGLESGVATDASELRTPALIVAAGKPCHLTVTRVPGGGWLVSSSLDLSGRVSSSRGDRLFPLDSLATGKETEFRCLLAASDAVAVSAKAWLRDPTSR